MTQNKGEIFYFPREYIVKCNKFHRTATFGQSVINILIDFLNRRQIPFVEECSSQELFVQLCLSLDVAAGVVLQRAGSCIEVFLILFIRVGFT